MNVLDVVRTNLELIKDRKLYLRNELSSSRKSKFGVTKFRSQYDVESDSDPKVRFWALVLGTILNPKLSSNRFELFR